MPRSGTTLMMNIINSYAEEKSNISQYFHWDSIIVDDNIKLRSRYCKSKATALTSEEITYRIEKLKKYKDRKIPIKILPIHMTNAIFKYIKNKYQRK